MLSDILRNIILTRICILCDLCYASIFIDNFSKENCDSVVLWTWIKMTKFFLIKLREKMYCWAKTNHEWFQWRGAICPKIMRRCKPSVIMEAAVQINCLIHSHKLLNKSTHITRRDGVFACCWNPPASSAPGSHLVGRVPRRELETWKWQLWRWTIYELDCLKSGLFKWPVGYFSAKYSLNWKMDWNHRNEINCRKSLFYNRMINKYHYHNQKRSLMFMI